MSKAKVCIVKCNLSFFTPRRKKRFSNISTILYLPFSKAGSVICWHLIWTYLSSHFCPSHKLRLLCSSWISQSCRDHYTTISVVKEDLCIWIQLVFIFWLIDDDLPWGHCPVCPFLFPGTGVVSVAFDFPSSSLCLNSYECTSHIFFMKDTSIAVL